MLALLIRVLASYTETRFFDWINPRKWKSVFIILLKKLLRKLDDSEIFVDAHEIEQYHFRMLMCQPCLPENKCVSCGCKTIEKMNIRYETCSKGRWGKFKSKEDWETYKQDMNIVFKLLLNNQDSKDIEV